MTFIRTAAGVLVGLLATASPVLGQSTRVDVQGGTLSIETIETGLVNPWGLAFLPDGRMLVTERPGRLRVIALDGSMSKALEGLPEIFAQGQGGLLDVAASPDFAETGWVYVSYAEPG
ncbi:MAG TPA: PQQ-dependent sugar dehydrogenase, partial [Thalassobaculum sp.]